MTTYDYVNKEVIHITPVLAKLHWLPVKSRISFKLATLVYSIRQSASPSYLASLLIDYKPVTELQSSSNLLLEVTQTQAQDFTESIASLGSRGLELYSVDCEGMQNHWNFKKND